MTGPEHTHEPGARSGLVAFRTSTGTDVRSGVVVGGTLIGLPEAIASIPDLLETPLDDRAGAREWQREPGRLELFLAIDGWSDIVGAVSTADAGLQGLSIPWNEVVLRPPVTRPQKIVALGLNYQSHAADAQREVSEYPVLFAKFPNTLTGPSDDVPIPRASHRIDYEGELAVIIGRRTSEISRAEADGAVAGYAVANDVSARDYQFRTKEMLQGKSFDSFCPLGPWISKPRSTHDLGGLSLTTRVNGDVRQSAALGEMVFDVPFMIEYISAIMTLEPGDVILTGTPGGVGAGMSPRRWLRDGDTVTIDIGEIGRIENRFVAPAPAPPRP